MNWQRLGWVVTWALSKSLAKVKFLGLTLGPVSTSCVPVERVSDGSEDGTPCSNWSPWRN